MLERLARSLLLNPPAVPRTVARLVLGDRHEIAGKTVLLTGASSGVGRAAAHALGRDGARLILVARTAEPLLEVRDAVRANGGQAEAVTCDLSDADDTDALVKTVLDEYGTVDVLVNNAGRSIRRQAAEATDRFHDYERTMQLNYFAPVRLMLGLLPGMRERKLGHVINVSSAGVQTRVPRFGAYIASKAALDTLSDAWQAETNDENVHFTTIFMPLVRTPMIAPTKLYDRFPALTPEQAGKVVCDAIVSRPRRVSPPMGRFASFADSISPEIMDGVRNRGFKMFPDSKAAVGKPSDDSEPLSATDKAFVEATRGVHW